MGSDDMNLTMLDNRMEPNNGKQQPLVNADNANTDGSSGEGLSLNSADSTGTNLNLENSFPIRMPDVTYIKNKKLPDSLRIRSSLAKQSKCNKVSISDRISQLYETSVQKEKHIPSWKSEFLKQVDIKVIKVLDKSYWEIRRRPNGGLRRIVQFAFPPKYPIGTWRRFCACLYCRWKRANLGLDVVSYYAKPPITSREMKGYYKWLYCYREQLTSAQDLRKFKEPKEKMCWSALSWNKLRTVEEVDRFREVKYGWEVDLLAAESCSCDPETRMLSHPSYVDWLWDAEL